MSSYTTALLQAEALDDFDLELAIMGTDYLLEHGQLPEDRVGLLTQQRAFNAERERRNSH